MVSIGIAAVGFVDTPHGAEARAVDSVTVKVDWIEIAAAAGDIIPLNVDDRDDSAPTVAGVVDAVVISIDIIEPIAYVDDSGMVVVIVVFVVIGGSISKRRIYR